MKFEGKDFPFRRADILKNRGKYKLMYQNVICQCKTSLQRSKVKKKCNTYRLVGYVEEMKAYSRFHGLPSNRQNPFNITATPRSKAQAMTTTPQESIVRETKFSHMGHLIHSTSLSTALYDFRQKAHIFSSCPFSTCPHSGPYH